MAEVMIGVARGERPLNDLDDIGLRLKDHGGILELRPPPGTPVVPVTWRDLALGFLNHLGKPSLAEWASFVIMAEYDFPQDRTEEEERFLELIYDASSNWAMDPESISIARGLADQAT